MSLRRISTRNIEADDDGILFDVEVDGRWLRTRVSYLRLLQRPPTRAERALPPKYLLEGRLAALQALVDEAVIRASDGGSVHAID